MIGASHDPSDNDAEITRRVADRAHQKGPSVDAKLGMPRGVEEDIVGDEGNACLMNQNEVVEFIQRTGWDAPAAAIGTSHGADKFMGQQSIHFEVSGGIRDKVKAAGFPPVPLVMHGSSSVPKEEVVPINAAGGTLDPGVCAMNEEKYLPAVRSGVMKVNIDTEGRVVWTRVHREYFRDRPGKFDFRPSAKIFMHEYAKFIAHKATKLGSAGKVVETKESLNP